MLDLNCPSCKSEQTQRLTVIFQQGISDISTSSKTLGIGIGRGGLGIGAGNTKTTGVSQTALSITAAPPAKKRILKPIGGLFVITLILSLFVGHNQILNGLLSIAFFGGAGLVIWHAVTYNTKQWPILKAAWDNSYMCHRCNHIFQVEQAN